MALVCAAGSFAPACAVPMPTNPADATEGGGANCPQGSIEVMAQLGSAELKATPPDPTVNPALRENEPKGCRFFNVSGDNFRALKDEITPLQGTDSGAPGDCVLNVGEIRAKFTLAAEFYDQSSLGADPGIVGVTALYDVQLPEDIAASLSPEKSSSEQGPVLVSEPRNGTVFERKGAVCVVSTPAGEAGSGDPAADKPLDEITFEDVYPEDETGTEDEESGDETVNDTSNQSDSSSNTAVVPSFGT